MREHRTACRRSGSRDNARMAKPAPRLSAADIARVIEIAWDDHPPFNAVLLSHGLNEGQLVALLKRELTASAYKLWAKRAGTGRGPAPRRR
jgi:uncharacterized protein (TIGR03643 family)